MKKAGIRWVKDGKGNIMGVGKVKDVFPQEKPEKDGTCRYGCHVCPECLKSLIAESEAKINRLKKENDS